MFVPFLFIGSINLFSQGNGSNCQLVAGNTDIQKLPYKLDALQGLLIREIATAKFHSVVVTASRELYSWGFGRGGRLGHPDFDIHQVWDVYCTDMGCKLYEKLQLTLVENKKSKTVVYSTVGQCTQQHECRSNKIPLGMWRIPN